MIIFKRLSIFLGILLVATSCYQYNKPEKPKDLISKDQMVNILIDIKLLTSANGKNRITLDDNKLYPETYVYKKHNIDSLRFAKSNNYYAYYTEEYDDIYSKIKDSLEMLQSVLKAVEKKELEEEEAKRKRDSIKLAKKIENHALYSLKYKDSIKHLFKNKDSLSKTTIQKTLKKGALIKPVSDTDVQQ